MALYNNNNTNNNNWLYSPGWALASSTNVAIDLYPWQLPANFYKPVSLRLPLPVNPP